jgi:hypothetical protein
MVIDAHDFLNDHDAAVWRADLDAVARLEFDVPTHFHCPVGWRGPGRRGSTSRRRPEFSGARRRA